MEVSIPYGEEKIKVNISQPCEILIPNKIKVKDEKKIIKDALRKPAGINSFEEFVQKSNQLHII